MLWYKAWLETRWRFLIGLAILMIMACGTVFDYPRVASLMPFARSINAGGPVGRALARAIEFERTYRGFIWWQWVRQNLAQSWTLVATLLGAGGLFAASGGGGTLFTLSLPASRTRVVGVRAAAALGELLVIAVVPSLLIPLLSPAIGQSYSAGDAIVHGLCIFFGGAVFFSLSLLLSTVFADVWRPALIACLVAILVALAESVILGDSRFGIFGAMTAESYFSTGSLPWPGLLISAAFSAALLYAAVVNVNQMDF